MPFYRNYSTKGLTNYWLRKSGDYWKDYLKTWNHPHRNVISSMLKRLTWYSLVEFGCGSGPNLANIVTNIPNRQLAGIDINPEAIKLARESFKGAMFRVESCDNVLLSDKASDIVLSDMLLIYVGPLKIQKYLKEMRRIARNYIVLHEFHEKSWWRRQYLRIFSGRHSYDYKKRLQKLGFYDINIYAMPVFEKDNEQRFRYLIIAAVPKRYVQ